MMCELCGKEITEGLRVRLEGGLVTACRGCAGLGEVVSEVKPVRKKTPVHADSAAAEKPEFKVEGEYDVVEDYGARIKAAREGLGWTQEDLGRMVNEPHSVVHRMESGRFEPSPEVAKKLERKLNVKLLVPHAEAEAPRLKQDSKGITLGDMVVVRKRSA